jgi:hypothetical protein
VLVLRMIADTIAAFFIDGIFSGASIATEESASPMPQFFRPWTRRLSSLAANCCQTVFVFGFEISSRYSMLLPVSRSMTSLANKGEKLDGGGLRNMSESDVLGASSEGMAVARKAYE